MGLMKVLFDRNKLNGIIRGLEGSPEAIKDELKVAMTSSVLQIHSVAVKPGYAPYKLGDLRRSILWDVAFVGTNKIQGAVGSNLDYARIHELGGFTGRGHKSFIKPKRYLSRAVEESTDDIRKRFRNIKVLKKS